MSVVKSRGDSKLEDIESIWREGGLKVVSFKIDPDLLWLLEKTAKEKKLTKSELIRIAIRRYINEENNRCKPYVTRRIRVYTC